MQSTSFEENEEVNFSCEKCKGIMTQVADRVLSNEHLRSVPTGWLDSECERITTWKNKHIRECYKGTEQEAYWKSIKK